MRVPQRKPDAATQTCQKATESQPVRIRSLTTELQELMLLLACDVT